MIGILHLHIRRPELGDNPKVTIVVLLFTGYLSARPPPSLCIYDRHLIIHLTPLLLLLLLFIFHSSSISLSLSEFVVEERVSRNS